MREERIAEIYHRISNAYQIFSENGNEWEANGLNSTPFKNLVSDFIHEHTPKAVIQLVLRSSQSHPRLGNRNSMMII